MTFGTNSTSPPLYRISNFHSHPISIFISLLPHPPFLILATHSSLHTIFCPPLTTVDHHNLMKIQCDVCSQNEASVYCSADEAPLCFVCDERVHHANKLAGKHPRFSLHHPTLKETPICDICQDKKAFLFCQQDRAILCKDCDGAIHKVNQHTQKHNRFLLTGVKLSPKASLYSSSSTPLVTLDTNSTKNGVVPEHQEKPLSSPIRSKINTTIETTKSQLESNGSGHGSDTSSISEYLIDMLPGWHVEDFLDPSPASSKKLVGDKDPIWDNDKLDGSFNNSLSPESMGIWVPQAPPQVAPSLESLSRYAGGYPVQQFEPSSYIGFGDQTLNGSSLIFGQDNSYNNFNKMNTNSGVKASRKWTSDNGNCFTVPQISHPSTNFKRPRTFWH